MRCRVADLPQMSSHEKWLRRAVTSASGCFNHKNIAGAHRGLIRVRQVGARAVGALDPIGPDGAGLSAGHSVGRNSAVPGEDRGGHGLQKTNATRRAVSTAPFSGPAAAAPDFVPV